MKTINFTDLVALDAGCHYPPTDDLGESTPDLGSTIFDPRGTILINR